MTPQEQADCERVAAWFEPKPEVNHDYAALRDISPNGYWRIEYRDRALRWTSNKDFIGDEYDNALLRDAMLAAGWNLTIGAPHALLGKIQVKAWRGFSSYIAEEPDAMRAIFGAFLKFMEVSK